MGRPAGSLNKKTQALIDRAEDMGVDPFEILCLVAKGDAKALGYDTSAGYRMDIELRFSAAKELAQYIYPKRSAVKVSTGDEDGFKIIIEDYTTKEKKP